MAPKKADGSTGSVYLWIPNLIGYARIIFAFIAFRYAFTDPVMTSVCYFISMFLDAFDGWAARAFNQSSQFGAVLDMVTDRFSTMILCAVLSALYPLDFSPLDSSTMKSLGIPTPVASVLNSTNDLFGLLSSTWIRDMIYFFMVLDLVSHWYHMYASLLTGQTSHKNMNTDGNFLIRLYYSNKIMLFCCCAATEMFWGSLYLKAMGMGFSRSLGISTGMVGVVTQICLVLSAPLFIFKHFMNLLQLQNAADSIVVWEMNGKRK